MTPELEKITAAGIAARRQRPMRASELAAYGGFGLAFGALAFWIVRALL